MPNLTSKTLWTTVAVTVAVVAVLNRVAKQNATVNKALNG